MKKNIEQVVDGEETVETPVTEEVVSVGKPKWSLKKKLIVAGAAVATLILGAVALGLKNKTQNAGEGQVNLDGTEEQELIAMEEQEAEAAELTLTEF